MEWKRVRFGSGRTLIPALRLGLLLMAVPAAGCVSALDQARTAWDDGAGSYEDAEVYYKEAIAKGGADADVARDELLELNVLLAQDLHKKKPKQAEVHYRNVLELDPDHEDAREGLARLLMTQYRHDEALEVAQVGVQRKTCRGCGRLTAVLLTSRADNRMASGDAAGAEADYTAAMAIIPDSNTALALVGARVAQKNVKCAAESLSTAAELIGRDDVGQRARFLELRRDVVLLALDASDVELADQMLDLAPTGVGASEQLGLATEVAMRFSALGKPDDALARMQAIVEQIDSGKLRIPPARAEEVRDSVADLLAARAIQRLSEGDQASAKADIADALKMRPANANVQLLEVVLLAASDQVGTAKTKLAKVDDKARGKKEVGALLEVMNVDDLVASGKVAEAKAAVDRAKAAGGSELPEVHIALAEVLAATPVEGLKKADLDLLKAKGLVKYPGKPTRVGEALSELAWAAKAQKAQGRDWPFRAPGFDARDKALRDKVGAYYTASVEFQGEPKAVLALSSGAAEPLAVKVGGSGADTSVTVPAGQSVDVAVPRPGVVTLDYGGTSAAFLAEPYTRVALKL
jgi:tetratricopeptide (TPR) repeat protein